MSHLASEQQGELQSRSSLADQSWRFKERSDLGPLAAVKHKVSVAVVKDDVVTSRHATQSMPACAVQSFATETAGSSHIDSQAASYDSEGVSPSTAAASTA